MTYTYSYEFDFGVSGSTKKSVEPVMLMMMLFVLKKLKNKKMKIERRNKVVSADIVSSYVNVWKKKKKDNFKPIGFKPCLHCMDAL